MEQTTTDAPPFSCVLRVRIWDLESPSIVREAVVDGLEEAKNWLNANGGYNYLQQDLICGWTVFRRHQPPGG
jgi:hypothetical protein